MDQAEIESGLVGVCAHLNAAHGRLVELVAAALASRCWEGAGILTCEQWVAWHTGCSPHRARELVAVARRSVELPETVAALRSGELSLDQVAVVAAHTPARYEGAVAAFARSATVSQLRRSLRHHHFGVDPPEAPGWEPNGLTQGFDGDGRYRLRAVLDADEGAIVRQALQEAHDALFRTSEGRVSGADALVEMARRSLATVTPLARRDAFLAIFHVPVGSSPGHLHGGPVLPDRLRRQLLCDGRGMRCRGAARPAGRLGPLDADRADPVAAADRGARSRVSGARVHGDAGADPPPPPLGGRRHDGAVEPGVVVPSSPPSAPRRRAADRGRS